MKQLKSINDSFKIFNSFKTLIYKFCMWTVIIYIHLSSYQINYLVFNYVHCTCITIHMMKASCTCIDFERSSIFFLYYMFVRRLSCCAMARLEIKATWCLSVLLISNQMVFKKCTCVFVKESRRSLPFSEYIYIH